MQRSDDESSTVDLDRLADMESEVSTEAGTRSETETRTSAESGDQGRSLGDRFGDVFSLKAFLLSTLLVGVAVVAGGSIPFIGTVGSLAGVFLASFIIGVVASGRRYLETAVAGGGITGASFGIGLLSVGVLPVGVNYLQEYGLAFVGAGVVLGAALALVGHYFGRDLRDGLTKEID